jgi:hypothetical protein
MSYTWRSILKEIQLMKQGMVWRVGDGRGLKIWNDPWLPRDASRKPFTPRGTSLVTDVDELIDPVTGEPAGKRFVLGRRSASHPGNSSF